MMNKKNNETTLTHLTKRFVKLLNANSDRVINLNEASTHLSVAKRRIYDITNVLEGIGLLQKISKNVTRWVDCPRESPFAAPPTVPTSNNIQHPHHHQQQQLLNQTAIKQQDVAEITAQIPGINFSGLPDAELLALVQTYQKLDEDISHLEANIRQHFNVEEAYVTYHDIKKSFIDQTVIAVRAPSDARLEVNEDCQIAIKSEHGQIEVYLSTSTNNSTNINTISLNNNNNTNTAATTNQQQLSNVYQTNLTPYLQQSQPSNSTNTTTTTTTSSSQPLDSTFTNSNNLIGQTQSQPYTSASSDEGRGRSSTTDGGYELTSGVSDSDYYPNDPTLSSALSMSEDEDPFKLILPYDEHEVPQYNFVLEENCSIASLFPEDNLGLL